MDASCKNWRGNIKVVQGILPRWRMYPVAAVPKTPASTPAVFDSPNKTPCIGKDKLKYAPSIENILHVSNQHLGWHRLARPTWAAFGWDFSPVGLARPVFTKSGLAPTELGHLGAEVANILKCSGPTPDARLWGWIRDWILGLKSERAGLWEALPCHSQCFPYQIWFRWGQPVSNLRRSPGWVTITMDGRCLSMTTSRCLSRQQHELQG